MFDRKKTISDAFRRLRLDEFRKFDIYKLNILYGIEEETREEREAIMAWYQEMLDFPEQITENTRWSDFPKTPARLKYYT